MIPCQTHSIATSCHLPIETLGCNTLLPPDLNDLFKLNYDTWAPFKTFPDILTSSSMSLTIFADALDDFDDLETTHPKYLERCQHTSCTSSQSPVMVRESGMLENFD